MSTSLKTKHPPANTRAYSRFTNARRRHLAHLLRANFPQAPGAHDMATELAKTIRWARQHYPTAYALCRYQTRQALPGRLT